MELTNKDLIFTSKAKSKKDLFEQIASKVVELKYLKNKTIIIKQLLKREEEFSTGMEHGLAIPHAKLRGLKSPKILVIRMYKNYQIKDYKTLDNSIVNTIICILTPSNTEEKHFEILTKLTSKLTDVKVINKFKQLTKPQLVSFVNKINEEEKVITTNKKDLTKKKSINLVGVTTCATGVAHTFIAGKALETEGAKRGWNVRIEKQGQITKDKLTGEEIEKADYVLIAAGKGIDEPERFFGKKVYETNVAEPITKASKVLDDTISKAKIQNNNTKGKDKTNVKGIEKKERRKFGTGPMRHLLSGISYMIPFIAMAGITLGITTAIGYGTITDPITGDTSFGPLYPWAVALTEVANAGFTLSIVFLGGFIANSISGRHAIAPAAIVSLFLNDPAGKTLFNYEIGNFGGFDPTTNPVSLGFFGAIAAGYLIGYGINLMTKQTDKISYQWFQTILPLLLIPIIWTLIPWAFFAFVGYLPLYYLGVGLQEGVKLLETAGILWMVGIILGGMICFDLGGPVNKMAMVTAVFFLDPQSANYNPLINGVAAVAVSIPPMTLLLVALLGKWTGIGLDENDETAAYTASIMGFFGITEGSIPFAAKKPKTYIPSFVIAGMVGGAIAIPVGVGNSVAMWGGPIIYIAGGMGNALKLESGIMKTDYVYAALYFIPLIFGAIAGFISISIFENIYKKIEKSKKVKSNNEVPNKIKGKKVFQKVAK